MVSNPGLALAIARPGHPALSWQELLPLLQAFWGLLATHLDARFRAGRLKQWLNYLRRQHPQAQEVYSDVRTLNDPALVTQRLFGAAMPTAC
jgi:tRNA-dihydrouridine synthase C